MKSRLFLLVWTLAPLLVVLTGVLGLHDFDPHLAVSLVALTMAGLWFPLEVLRDPPASPSVWPIALLLLFLTPSWMAAGRLSGAGWRAGVSLLLVACWMAIPWTMVRWTRRNGGELAARLRVLQILFALLGGLPPLLAFVSRNFGGEDWPRLAAISPFSAIFHLTSGHGDWKIGAIVSGALFFLTWIRARAADEVLI